VCREQSEHASSNTRGQSEECCLTGRWILRPGVGIVFYIVVVTSCRQGHVVAIGPHAVAAG
jgi:hypothetical protein